ncbi:MAG TPA: sensor histidine kinase, partial [Ignavibacteriaceae bacterium]
SRNIHADISVENISFDIDSAITMGLIINELASNAYKHAFRGRRAGKISVAISRHESRYVLIVKDDGVGIPVDLAQKKSDSLGLQLVETLIDQLHGKLEIKSDRGTEVRIEFGDEGVSV